MTVEEMIEELKKYPLDTLVFKYVDGYPYAIGQITKDKDGDVAIS